MVKLSQHFLVSESVRDRIVKAASLTGKDVVLEIGPGKGFLTEALLKVAKKVYAIELDRKLCSYLKSKFSKEIKDGKLEVVCGDALKYDFPRHITKIVSNLPYKISSPIVERIILFGKPSVLMFQKEFAERMVAKPGNKNYSRLSFLVRYLADAEIVLYVPRRNFKPIPKVDSAVVKMVPKRIKVDRELLFVAKLLFQHKRKKVITALVSERRHFTIQDKKKLKAKLQECLGTIADTKVLDLDVDDMKSIKTKIRNILKSAS